MNAGIIGIGSAVPKDSYTNDDMVMMTGLATDNEWITTRTGIKTRHLARSYEKTSDYAFWAAEKAIACAEQNNPDFKREKIGVILLATSAPDRECPATATLVAHRLGFNCLAYDVKVGCAGFAAALQSAKSYVVSGEYQYVLVIGADLLSRITNYEDRNSCILFADAAGAVVVGAVDNGKGIGPFVTGSDGSGVDKLFIPTASEAVELNTPKHPAKAGTLFMVGTEVYLFAVDIMEKVIRELAEKTGVSIVAIDWIFAHQANMRIIMAVAKALGLPMDKFYVNVDRYGNTSAASIPLALDEAYREGKLAPGMKLILVAFGAGLSWAGCFMEWSLKQVAQTGNG